MKTIGQFTKGSWLWNFYVSTYEGQEPNANFCDYFWGLVLAFISLPITWISYCITGGFKNRSWGYGERFWASLFLEAILIGIGCGFYTNWLKALYVTIALLIALLIFALIIWGIVAWGESDTKEALVTNWCEIKTTASTGFHSWKDKYCPKIEWVENPNKPAKTEE